MVSVKTNSEFTLEEALLKCEFGKFNYALIVLAGAVLGSVFLETVSINFILPVAQCDLNMSNQNKGLLSAIGFAGIIVSSHLWGFLADTRGRRAVIIPTLSIAFILTIISSFTKSFSLLVVLRFFNGFFISGPSATIYVYLGEFHCGRNRSKVMMLGSTMYATFCYWNPIFASIFINQEWSFYIEPLNLLFKPWRLFMIICGTPSLICALIMLWMPESPKFIFSQGDEHTALKILENVYVCNTGRPRETFAVKSLVKDEEYEESNKKKPNNLFYFMWTQTMPLFQHPNLKNTLRACFIQFCIFNTSNGFWTFFPEITNRITIWAESDSSHVSGTLCQIIESTQRNISHTNGTIFIASKICITKLETETFSNVFILNTIYFLGWLFLVFIINRVGKLIIITTLLYACGICGFSLIFVNQPLVSSYLYILLLSVGLTLTVLNASTVELFPTRLRAMALCLSLMSGRIGSVVGSNVIGALLDSYCNYTFAMPTILLISSGCLAFTIPNISNKI